jgi:hypothetical protein
MTGRVAGICYIKVDGVQLAVHGGLEMPMAETKKEAVTSTGGVVGYKEEIVPPFIKLSAVYTDDFPREDIEQGTAMTITAELPNGQAYTLSDAFLSGEATVKTEDGTIELNFGGKKGSWQ